MSGVVCSRQNEAADMAEIPFLSSHYTYFASSTAATPAASTIAFFFLHLTIAAIYFVSTKPSNFSPFRIFASHPSHAPPPAAAPVSPSINSDHPQSSSADDSNSNHNDDGFSVSQPQIITVADCCSDDNASSENRHDAVGDVSAPSSVSKSIAGNRDSSDHTTLAKVPSSTITFDPPFGDDTENSSAAKDLISADLVPYQHDIDRKADEFIRRFYENSRRKSASQ